MVPCDIKPEGVSPDCGNQAPVPEGQEWRWCLVGNIVDAHPFGEEEETRNGTKYFGPGTKVYCAPGQCGDGYENIVVIGKPRRSRKYVCLVIPSKRIENFRIQKVFSPAILNIMAKDDWYWWDNTDKDRLQILELLESMALCGTRTVRNEHWPEDYPEKEGFVRELTAYYDEHPPVGYTRNSASKVSYATRETLLQRLLGFFRRKRTGP